MFGINMDMFETYAVNFEIYVGNKLVQNQQVQAPREMLMMNFIQLMEQIGNEQQPMKIKMIKPETIWNNFDNSQKILNNEIEFSNNAMIAFEKDKETSQ